MHHTTPYVGFSTHARSMIIKAETPIAAGHCALISNIDHSGAITVPDLPAAQ
jgi:hypothetical protein